MGQKHWHRRNGPCVIWQQSLRNHKLWTQPQMPLPFDQGMDSHTLWTDCSLKCLWVAQQGQKKIKKSSASWDHHMKKLFPPQEKQALFLEQKQACLWLHASGLPLCFWRRGMTRKLADLSNNGGVNYIPVRVGNLWPCWPVPFTVASSERLW